MTRLAHHAHLAWTGSTGAGYRVYPRAHDASAPPAAASLRLSADPHFRGDADLLNPEQLVVLAAGSCQMLSFLSLAARKHVDVVGYEDEATGYLSEDLRKASIDLIELRPVIKVAAGTDEALVRSLVQQGHEECYIANSLKSEIVIEATIVVADTQQVVG
jgi:organic hydroperoxide reductase OsmC/OhrA